MLITYYRKSRKSFFSSCFLLLFFAFQSFTLAQTGTIRGRILDLSTKDPLVGANIVVKGTNLGAASDLDGNFVVKNVPSGNQTVVVSYIGYEAITVNVNVPDNKILEQNFSLAYKTVEGETVTVTSQAKGQLSAINQQLAANNLVNVVSAEKMQELPDANIAESIGRLPGISLKRNAGEAYAVTIRGLSPKYNEVTIEGVPMVSTNYYDRGIDLSLLSDDLIKGVEVSKTLRPDMDADALGGTVNLTLRTAPSGLHYNFWGNGGYTNLRDTYDNYKFTGSVSNRFFDDKLGVLAQGNIELKQLPSDQFNAAYETPRYDNTTQEFYVVTQNAQLQEVNAKQRRYGLSLILDYKTDLVDLKLLNVFDQKSDSNITRSQTFRFNSNEHYDQIFDNETITKQRMHSLQALFKLGNTELPISLSYTKGEQNVPNGLQFDIIQGSLPNIPTNQKIYRAPADLIGIQGLIDPYSPNTNLNNLLTSDSKLTDESYDAKIDWKAPFKFSDNFSVNFSTGAKYHHVKRTSVNTQYYLMLQYGAGAGNRTKFINEYAFLNGVTDDNQSGIPAYPFVDKNYNRNDILGYPFGPSWDVYKLANTMNDFYAKYKSLYWKQGPNSYNQNYNDEENTVAGYVMGEFNFGNSLTIVPGVRYQEEKTDISAYHIRVDFTQPTGLDNSTSPRLVEAKRDFPHWYPSVNIKYKATENIQILGAAYRSVSLPSFRDISPLVVLQDGENVIVTGNPLLKPSTAWNFDLGASVFSNNIGLFTVNLFYKEISDLIYGMQNYYIYFPYPIVGAPQDILDGLPDKSYFDSTWYSSARRASKTAIPVNDPEKAYLRGIEFSWQTHLWYLPGVLNGLVLDLNLSLMSSNQLYPYFELKQKTSILAPDTLVYRTRGGPLQDQPKAIYNAIIGWDYKGFSSRFSFRYQQKTLTSKDTQFGLRDSYYDNVLLVDISLKQELYIKGLSIFANATNINKHVDDYNLSHPTFVTANPAIAGTYPAAQLPTSGQTYGWALQFGVSYSY